MLGRNRLIEFAAIGNNETVTNCCQLKMLARDGKMRLVDGFCLMERETWLI